LAGVLNLVPYYIVKYCFDSQFLNFIGNRLSTKFDNLKMEAKLVVPGSANVNLQNVQIFALVPVILLEAMLLGTQ